MKNFFRWYGLLLKRALRRADSYLSVLAMILLVLVIANIKLPSVDNVRVLVYAQTEEDRAAIMEALDSADHVYEFELADSEEAIKEAVISGEVECGFALTADFRDKLANKEQKDIVNLYCSNLSTKAEVALESFYSAVLQIASKEWLIASYPDLYEEGADGAAAITADLEAREQELRDSAALFYIVEETIAADGTVVEKTESGEDAIVGVDLASAADRISARTHPVRGTVAIFVFLMIFLAIGRNLKTEKSGFAMYLSAGERMSFRVAVAASSATLPVLSGAILLTAMGQTGSVGHELLCWCALVCYSILWCILLARILKKESTYMASLIAVLLATCALCPVYLYIETYVPVAKYLQWLFPVSVFLI